MTLTDPAAPDTPGPRHETRIATSDRLSNPKEITVPETRESMTFAGFSAANRRRCESPQGFNHALDSWSPSDWITATIGELGEAANIVKKLNRCRDGIPGNKVSEAELRAELRHEIADTVVYLDLFAQFLGFDLGEAVREKFNMKSQERGYPVVL